MRPFPTRIYRPALLRRESSGNYMPLHHLHDCLVRGEPRVQTAVPIFAPPAIRVSADGGDVHRVDF